MRKLAIITALLISASAMAQTTNDYAVYSDGTRLFSKGGGTWTNVNMTMGDNSVFRVNKAELSMTNDQAQVFTATAGFEQITNLTQKTVGHFTSTATSLVTHVTGDIVVFMASSYESSAVNNVTDNHLFTNGVEVPLIGWTRKLATVNDQGSAAAQGMLLNVPSGTVFSVEIDVDKDSTLTFDHYSLILMQQ